MTCKPNCGHGGLLCGAPDCEWASVPPVTNTPQPDIKRRKAGKLRVDLVPPGVDQAIATVMTGVLDLGLKGEDDWFVLLDDPPLDVERMLAAAVKRHAIRVLEGEEYDEETGVPHVQCILTGASIWNAILYHRQAIMVLASRGHHYKDTGQEATGAYLNRPTVTIPDHACLGFPCDECRRLYALEAVTRKS